jgi:hypothetical protein
LDRKLNISQEKSGRRLGYLLIGCLFAAKMSVSAGMYKGRVAIIGNDVE